MRSRASRLLVSQVPDGHRVVAAPTTRDLMFTMTGEPRPELTIYVEDTFAQMVVEQALYGAHRRRVRVVPIGSAERTVGQLGTHLSAGLDGPAICVLDGDCEDSDLRRWMRSAGIDDSQLCRRLPVDGLSPERWIVEARGRNPTCIRLPGAGLIFSSGNGRK